LVVLALSTKDAERLTFTVTIRAGGKDVTDATDLRREYVETLK
jgi:hypothetical protein